MEAFVYLLFRILFSLVFFRKRRIVAILTVFSLGILIALFAFAVRQHIGPKFFDLAHGPTFLFRGVAEFSLGMVAYRMSQSRSHPTAKIAPWITPALALAIILLLTVQGTDLLVVMLVPFLILFLYKSRDLVSRALSCGAAEYLGVLSFSIYLWHFLLNPLISLIDALAARKHLQHAHTFGVAGAALVLWPLSVASYELLERPARRWLRTVLEREPNLASK